MMRRLLVAASLALLTLLTATGCKGLTDDSGGHHRHHGTPTTGCDPSASTCQ